MRIQFAMLKIIIICVLGVSVSARYNNVVPKYQDSAIIIDTDRTQAAASSSSSQSPVMQSQKSLANFISSGSGSMLPYYQPVQTIPAYKIFSKSKSKNETLLLKNDGHQSTAAIFTQEEFPRDLLEIAQQKLGLRTIDEVPSITELAELLGTNSAAETINYIRQLTSTEQGVALMKAYIESSDYTDSVGNNKGGNEVIRIEDETTTTTTMIPPKLNEIENSNSSSFFERISGFLNIFNGQTAEDKPILNEAPHSISTSLPQSSPNASYYRNLRRPIYVRSPLPYHYPVPLRPMPQMHQIYSGRYVAPPAVKTHSKPSAVVHMNTLKALTPAHIQQLARMAKIHPKTLESFLQRKPKLAELAAKVASYPLTRGENGNGQLLSAVQKAIENDEDLRQLLNSSDTLK